MEERMKRLWPIVVALLTFAACGTKVAPVAPGPERAVYELGDDGIEAPSIVEEVKPQYTAGSDGSADYRRGMAHRAH